MEDREWCVIKVMERKSNFLWDTQPTYYAMLTDDTSKLDRIQEDLTREEAEGLMKLLRTTQGESK